MRISDWSSDVCSSVAYDVGECRRAGGDDILPRRTAALRAGDDMIEGEIAVRPAILAGELVAQEEFEAGEGGELGRFHIFLECDHRRQLPPRGWTSALALVMVSDIEYFAEH